MQTIISTVTIVDCVCVCANSVQQLKRNKKYRTIETTQTQQFNEHTKKYNDEELKRNGREGEK